MKNICREYLYIPKDKHISTKVFTTHVVLSVISVLACTLAMFASSYAWFSTEVTSESNVIMSSYRTQQAIDQNGTTEDNGEGVSVAMLSAWDQHLFHIYPDGTASTGYCRVTLTYDGETEAFYTQQIEEDEYLVLAIRTAAGTEIEFEPFWGELEYHDRSDWDGFHRYGEIYEQEPAETFSLLHFDEEEEPEVLDAGEYIPGPRTPSKEYQFPQYATLEDIAAFYEIEVEDILIFNGIEAEEDIEIGDWLDLPFVDEEAEAFVPTPPDIEHEVVEGETIESIAELYDISIEELIEYNELEPVEIEEEEAEEEVGAVEPGVPMEQPDASEVQDEVDAEEEIDINELYPLTPGDIILIPFEIVSGYTPSDVVNEKDIPAVEPGTGEFVKIESESVFNPEEEGENDPFFDETQIPEQPQQPEESGGILSSGDQYQHEEEPSQEETSSQEEEPLQETESESVEQTGGILSAGS